MKKETEKLSMQKTELRNYCYWHRKKRNDSFCQCQRGDTADNAASNTGNGKEV